MKVLPHDMGNQFVVATIGKHIDPGPQTIDLFQFAGSNGNLQTRQSGDASLVILATSQPTADCWDASSRHRARPMRGPMDWNVRTT